jgi:hypothetical protein
VRRIVAMLVCLAAPAMAHASAADAIGLGSEESGVCGASAARVHDFSAGWYNPAGLALARTEATVGVVGFGSQLKITNGDFTRTQPIADPVGIVLGASTPIPFGGVLRERLYVGIALFIVPSGIVRVISHAPDQPFYPLYDNRTQRLMVLPTLAARLGYGFTLGITFNYLAGLDGRVSAAEGATRAIEARVDESIAAHLGVNVGVRWQQSRRLAVALVYRQEYGVPFRTVSRNAVAGQPIDLDVDAVELFAPHELVLGGALLLPKNVLASLDLQWSHWSGWRGPFVTVTSQLPLVGALDAKPPPVAFTDTFSFRAGVEWTAFEHARVALKLRGGYGFETQAAPSSQPGVTNLLDGPKHRLAVGAGVRLRVQNVALRVDGHGQLDIVQPETLTKKIAPAGSHPDPSSALADEVPDDPAKPATLGTQISNPGYPSISGGGFVWALGLTLTVER